MQVKKYEQEVHGQTSQEKSIDEQKIHRNKKLRKVAHEMYGQTGQEEIHRVFMTKQVKKYLLEIHWRSGSSRDE